MNFEIVKGRTHWRWRIVGKNGEIVCVSETFPSKANAKRALRRVLLALYWEVYEVKPKPGSSVIFRCGVRPSW